MTYNSGPLLLFTICIFYCFPVGNTNRLGMPFKLGTGPGLSIAEMVGRRDNRWTDV